MALYSDASEIMMMMMKMTTRTMTMTMMMWFVYERLTPRDFNSYGSRRGNDEVMARGTFANIRLFNKLVGQTGPKTVHIPSGQTVSCY